MAKIKTNGKSTRTVAARVTKNSRTVKNGKTTAKTSSSRRTTTKKKK